MRHYEWQPIFHYNNNLWKENIVIEFKIDINFLFPWGVEAIFAKKFTSQEWKCNIFMNKKTHKIIYLKTMVEFTNIFISICNVLSSQLIFYTEGRHIYKRYVQIIDSYKRGPETKGYRNFYLEPFFDFKSHFL